MRKTKKQKTAGRRKATRRRSRKKKRFFLKFFLLAVTLLISASAAYVYRLDQQARSRFEGKRWDLPAHVYSRPIEMYPGKQLKQSQLVLELRNLGYRPVDKPTQTGTYRSSKNQVEIVSRSFQFWESEKPRGHVLITFAGGSIASIVDLKIQRKLLNTRLEPRLIGSISPLRYEDRKLLKLEQVPSLLLESLLTIEDRQFMNHHGVDFRGLTRALWVNLRAGRWVQGGSTITQQLVKNMFLSSERTLWRKINELIMALCLERRYGKREILEAYINEVYLGQSGNRAIHGFDLGSWHYFTRPLQELNLAEIALLVGIIKGPSYYSPHRYSSRAIKRRNLVIDQVADLKLVSAKEVQRSKNLPLGVSRQSGIDSGKNPAFLDLVKRQIREQYDAESLTTEGLRILTTMNPLIQSVAEQSLAKRLASIEKQKNMKSGSLQGAVVVIRVESGEVVALVGGRNARFAGFNRALDARRPIGSLLKPAVYLTALSKGGDYTLATLVNDGPIRIKQADGSQWQPRNYDKQFRGEVPMLQAIAKSLNLPVVHLGQKLGIDAVRQTIQQLGVERDIPRVPALFLGSANLTPLEVAQMYQVYANGGFLSPLRSIRSILDHQQNPLGRYSLSVHQVIDPEVSFLLNYALQEVVRSGTASALKEILDVGLQIAGKTGTTNDYRDSWFAGYTGNYLAVTWVGRDDNKTINLTGSGGAMLVWADLMRGIGAQALVVGQPDNVDLVWVDMNSGLLADRDKCPDARQIPFIQGSQPRTYAPCAARLGGGSIRKWFDQVFRRERE